MSAQHQGPAAAAAAAHPPPPHPAVPLAGASPLHSPLLGSRELSSSLSSSITLQCHPSGEIKVDREQLCQTSKVFADMLSACETGTSSIRVEESLGDMSVFLEVARGIVPPATFDARSSACWDIFRRVIEISDKYDCAMVRERSEKWLVSRCLRGRVRCSDFKFQEVGLGVEWLALCQKYSLSCLGWYVAYDLGSQLADGAWASSGEALKDISDPELLKTMLEAVADKVQETRRAEAAAAAAAIAGRTAPAAGTMPVMGPLLPALLEGDIMAAGGGGLGGVPGLAGQE